MGGGGAVDERWDCDGETGTDLLKSGFLSRLGAGDITDDGLGDRGFGVITVEALGDPGVGFGPNLSSFLSFSCHRSSCRC